MKDPRATGTGSNVESIDALLKRLGVTAHYRPGTSDERVLREVLVTSPYRRKRIGFDVERGEHWLDLGANIGAFAVYCRMRGATADCYEPDEGCFEILRQNTAGLGFRCFRTAVSTRFDEYLPFWTSKSETDHHRGTTFPMKTVPLKGNVPNLHMRYVLDGTKYDGAKIDIEGTEGEILDAGLLPDCNKLALEYHLWRDPSMQHLRDRLAFLRTRFKTVSYPPEFDRMLASGYTENTSYYDRLVFCMR